MFNDNFRNWIASERLAGRRCVNMHMHSRASADAFAGVDAILRLAQRSGIGVAITDHNAIAGALEALEQREVFVVPGIEVTTAERVHILCYCKNREALRALYHDVVVRNLGHFAVTLPLQEFLPLAHRYADLIAAAHPFVRRAGGLRTRDGQYDTQLLQQIDAVEVINGMSAPAANRQAAAWAADTNLAITGGSDGHFARHVARVLTSAAGNNPTEFLRNIKDRQATVMGQPVNRITRFLVHGSKEMRVVIRRGGLATLRHQLATALRHWRR